MANNRYKRKSDKTEWDAPRSSHHSEHYRTKPNAFHKKQHEWSQAKSNANDTASHPGRPEGDISNRNVPPILNKFFYYLKNNKLTNDDEIKVFFEDCIKECHTKTIGFSLTMILRHLSNNRNNYTSQELVNLNFVENIIRLINHFLGFRAGVLAGTIHTKDKGHELSVEVLSLMLHRLVKLGHGNEKLFDFTDLPTEFTATIIKLASRCSIRLDKDLGSIFWALGALASTASEKEPQDVNENSETRDLDELEPSNENNRIFSKIIKSINCLDIKFLYSKILACNQVGNMTIANLNWAIAKLMSVNKELIKEISANDIAFSIDKINCNNIEEKVIQDTAWTLKVLLNLSPESLSRVSPHKITDIIKAAIQHRDCALNNVLWFIDKAYENKSPLVSLIKPWHVQQIVVKEANNKKADVLTTTSVLINFSQIISRDPSFFDDLSSKEIDDLAVALSKMIANLSIATSIPANLFQYTCVSIIHILEAAPILLKCTSSNSIINFLAKSNLIKSKDVMHPTNINNNFISKEYTKEFSIRDFLYLQGVLSLIDKLLAFRSPLLNNFSMSEIENIIDNIDDKLRYNLPAVKISRLLSYVNNILEYKKIPVAPAKILLIIDKLASYEKLETIQLKGALRALLMLLKKHPELLDSLKPRIDFFFSTLTKLPQSSDGNTPWLYQYDCLNDLNMKIEVFSATAQITQELNSLLAAKGNVFRKLVVAARLCTDGLINCQDAAFQKAVVTAITTYHEHDSSLITSNFQSKQIQTIINFVISGVIDEALAASVLNQLIQNFINFTINYKFLPTLVEGLLKLHKSSKMQDAINSMVKILREQFQDDKKYKKIVEKLAVIDANNNTNPSAIETDAMESSIAKNRLTQTPDCDMNTQESSQVFESMTSQLNEGITEKSPPLLTALPMALPTTPNDIKPPKQYDIKNKRDIDDLLETIAKEDPKAKFTYDFETNKNRTKHKLFIAPVAILENQYGVFAKEEITVDLDRQERVLLGCYAGKEYDLEEEDPDNQYFFMLYEKTTKSKHGDLDDETIERVVDAKQFGDWTRFMNHGCTPNVVVDVKEVRGVVRVYMYAVRTIKPGEQLIFDYTDEYFKLFGYTPFYMTENYGSKKPAAIYHDAKIEYANQVFSFDATFSRILQAPTSAIWVLPKGFEYIYRGDNVGLTQWLTQNNINLPALAFGENGFADTQEQPYLSLLAYACYLGNEEAIKLLMQCEPKTADQPTLIQGQLPLTFLMMGHASDEVVSRVSKMILQKMSYPFTNDKNKLNLLHYAIKRNLPDVVEAIIENAILKPNQQRITDDVVMQYDIFQDMINRSNDQEPYADLDYCLLHNQLDVLAVLINKLVNYEQFFDGKFFGLINKKILFKDENLNLLSLEALKHFATLVCTEKQYEKIRVFTNLSARIAAIIQTKEITAAETAQNIVAPAVAQSEVAATQQPVKVFDLNAMDESDIFVSETLKSPVNSNSVEIIATASFNFPLLDLNDEPPEDVQSTLLQSDDSMQVVAPEPISVISNSIFRQPISVPEVSQVSHVLSKPSSKFIKYAASFALDDEQRSRFLRESARVLYKYVTEGMLDLSDNQRKILTGLVSMLLTRALSLNPFSKYVLNDIKEFNLKLQPELIDNSSQLFSDTVDKFAHGVEGILNESKLDEMYKTIAKRCFKSNHDVKPTQQYKGFSKQK